MYCNANGEIYFGDRTISHQSTSQSVDGFIAFVRSIDTTRAIQQTTSIRVLPKSNVESCESDAMTNDN